MIYPGAALMIVYAIRMRAAGKTVVLPLLLAVCVGCSADDGSGLPPGCEPVEGSPNVEFGTGFDSFEPLADGANLEMFEDFQGGFHFMVASARAQGIAPGDPDDPNSECNPATTFQAFNMDGARIDDLDGPKNVAYVESAGGLDLKQGQFLILKGDAVDGLIDTEVRITVEVVDIDDRRATDEVMVVARHTTQ